jgi:aminocarboxymuconate-semialdehyde decarboxylase
MPVIDVHTHYIPPFVQTDGRSAGGVLGVRYEDGWIAHPEGFRYPLHREFVDVPAKLEGMDAAGIELAVLSLSPTMFFYESPADQATAFARRANDALAELIDGQDRLLAFAHLPLQDAQAAAEELDRCIGTLGFRGAHIGTSYDNGRPLDGPELEPVWAVAERHGCPLVLHPYYVGDKPGLEDFYFTNTLGNLIDTTVAASRLLHSGTLDRYPSVPVVLVHAGGFLPFQIGRLDHAYDVRREPRAQITEPPSTRLDRFWMDTITHSDEALAFLASRIGTARMVLGTDVPYDMGDPRPLERVRRAGVDELALGRTAEALIKPGPRIDRAGDQIVSDPEPIA